MDFIYDESGKPFALIYTNGTATPATYYYVLNLQGDVVGLVNSSGGWVAQYTYNAWGEVLTSTGNMASVNPLRYRGYYYDTETGFYYLQSRYYDPANHRFINADSYATTDATDAISCNMFAYCGNNPVLNADPTGEIAVTTIILIGAIVVGVGTAIYTGCKARKAGCDWADTAFYSVGAGLCAFATAYTLGMTAYQSYCYLNPLPSAPPAEKTSITYPPNDGFAEKPYSMTLEPGSQVERYGGIGGKYVTYPGTPASNLSLPPDKIGLQPVTYTVTAPIEVMAGTAEPWFGQPGGGVQYLLPHTIEQLIAEGKLMITK